MCYVWESFALDAYTHSTQCIAPAHAHSRTRSYKTMHFFFVFVQVPVCALHTHTHGPASVDVSFHNCEILELQQTFYDCFQLPLLNRDVCANVEIQRNKNMPRFFFLSSLYSAANATSQYIDVCRL